MLSVGLCTNSYWEANYYLDYTDQGDILYTGFLGSTIGRDGDRWVLRSGNPKEDDSISSAELAIRGLGSFPVGRFLWEVTDPSCSINESREMLVTFSNCVFGQEFSCDSGHCINIYQRCDNVKDCRDGSDEVDCHLVNVPESYRKAEPPEPDGAPDQPLPIQTHVTVLNVDSIDTVRMRIGLTIELQLSWRDARLTFSNLFDKPSDVGNVKEVPDDVLEKIWLPRQ